MKNNTKRMLALLLSAVMALSLLPALRTTANAAGIDDTSLTSDKQARGSTTCAVYANMYMARRRIALEDSAAAAKQITVSDFQPAATGSLTQSGVKSRFSYTAPNGAAHTFTRVDLFPNGSGWTNIASLSESDPGIRQITNGAYIAEYTDGTTNPELLTKVLAYLLTGHPEGITVWAYNGGNMHAALITRYDSSTGEFYCVDPVWSAPASEIKLAGSGGYLYNSPPTNYAKTQTGILKYICAFWYISDSTAANPTQTPTASAIPAAPTGFVAAWGSTRWTADLSWNASGGATSYEVQYRRDGIDWRTDPDYSGGTSYVTTGLRDWPYYQYRVRAVNAVGASAWAEAALHKTVTVTLDANGGSVSPNSVSFTYDSPNGVMAAYGTLPAPARAGFRFDGWYTAGGERVTDGTRVSATANHTLYARWTQGSALEQSHALTCTPAREATCYETGNREYWYCQECGKYFSDEAAAVEISREDALIPKLEHEFVDGICILCGESALDNVIVCVAGFTDVTTADLFAEAVQWAVDSGVTKGVSATKFSPGATVTRAQAVTFLWRAKGKPDPKSMVSPFADVTNTKASYYKAVLWAVEQGITTGVSKTKFAPTQKVTRGQMAILLWRAEGKPTASKLNTAHAASITNATTKKAVAWADSLKLLDGTKEAFAANAPCPRSDVVLYLYRYFK